MPSASLGPPGRFNPRSRTGSDEEPATTSQDGKCFNPRSRTGSDAFWPCSSLSRAASIHAPARGATKTATGQSTCRGFNPRSRTGSDLRGNLPPPYLLALQSTLPHGERHWTIVVIVPVRQSFNPRSRTGSDRRAYDHTPIPAKLQSTLPHGERRPCRPRATVCCRFNPRSRTGSDVGATQPMLSPASFNPRSRTGSDLIHARAEWRVCRFNPRSRTGSDFFLRIKGKATRSFNPRSRTGSDLPSILPAGQQGELQSTLPHGERPRIKTRSGR